MAKRFLFTIDVDWIPGSESGVADICAFCRDLDLDCTFFYAGKFVADYPEIVRESARLGFEMGTHGWAHGQLEKDDDEDFLVAPEADQRRWITEATEQVERCTGIRPIAFRAPNLRVSLVTLKILEELGYRYDSSVPARRLTVGYSQLNRWDQFWAPRDAYHPSHRSLGQRGDSPILEVPPSTWGVPINMSALRVFGFEKIAWAVRALARVTSNLVFYAHPAEFVPAEKQNIPSSNPKRHREGLGPQNFEPVARLVSLARDLGFAPSRYTDVTAA